MRPNALFNFQLLVISFYLLVSMFCNKLQNIEALLLYLFKFIFHANNQFLDVMIIGFGTHGIDFATDFLGDESVPGPLLSPQSRQNIYNDLPNELSLP